MQSVAANTLVKASQQLQQGIRIEDENVCPPQTATIAVAEHLLPGRS